MKNTEKKGYGQRMIPKKITLSDSLSLNYINTDKFKTEYLTVSFVMPIEKENSPLNSLVMSVLKRGTKKYVTQGEINKRLDDLYAVNLSIKNLRRGDNQLLGITAELLDNHYVLDDTDILDGTFEIISQMMFDPLLDENQLFVSQYVESEKQNTCDSIKSLVNNTRTYAGARCREIMFADEPYGCSLAGSVEQIEAVTSETLTCRYRDMIKDAKIQIFYIGAASREKIISTVKKYMGDFSSQPINIAPTIVKSRVDNIKTVTEKLPVSQGKLVIGLRTGHTVCDKQFFDFLVCNEILGGSVISKLFTNVREKMSLCYYCSSTYDIYKGAYIISAGVDVKNKDVARDAILAQIEEMRCGNISDEEFIAAKKSLYNSYRSIEDAPSVVEEYYAGRMLFGVECTIDECFKGFENVKKSDVIDAAKQLVFDTVYFLEGTEIGGDDDE